jgi:hypothetical protein
VPVVAAQPRQHPGPQERRFAHTGRSQDHEQLLIAGSPQFTDRGQGPTDLGVAPVVDRGVDRLQWLPPAIRRVVWSPSGGHVNVSGAMRAARNPLLSRLE